MYPNLPVAAALSASFAGSFFGAMLPGTRGCHPRRFDVVDQGSDFVVSAETSEIHCRPSIDSEKGNEHHNFSKIQHDWKRVSHVPKFFGQILGLSFFNHENLWFVYDFFSILPCLNHEVALSWRCKWTLQNLQLRTGWRSMDSYRCVAMNLEKWIPNPSMQANQIKQGVRVVFLVWAKIKKQTKYGLPDFFF